MTEEELIKRLTAMKTCTECQIKGKPCDDNCKWQYEAGNMGEIVQTLEQTIEALEQTQMVDKSNFSMEQYKADLETAHECGKSNWIPVTERLPEINQKVLVTSYGRVCYAMMTSADGNFGYPVFKLQDSLKERVVSETTAHNEFTTGRITAWMPLPKPYKEGE